MEQRIDYVLAHDSSRTNDSLSSLAAELKEAQERYDITVRSYERRIQEIESMSCRHSAISANRKTRQTALRSISPLSFTLALPLSFMFLTDVGSRSMYVSYGLWSMTFLLLFQMSAASFEPYQLNGGLVSAVAGRNFAIIGADTRMIGEGAYLLESRNHLTNRLWGVTNDAIMPEIEDRLRAGALVANAFDGILMPYCDNVPIMVGSSGCTTDCCQLKKMIQADVRSSMHFGQIQDLVPGQVANLLSQTLYQRRTFPYYAFCVVSGLDRTSGGCGEVYVYDAIGSFEQVAVASAGTGREQLQPILDGLFQSTSSSKYVEGSAADAIEKLCKGYRAVAEREIGVGDNLVLHVSEIDAGGEVTCKVFVFPLKKH
jgi:20S proteasome subunit beta 6